MYLLYFNVFPRRHFIFSINTPIFCYFERSILRDTIYFATIQFMLFFNFKGGYLFCINLVCFVISEDDVSRSVPGDAIYVHPFPHQCKPGHHQVKGKTSYRFPLILPTISKKKTIEMLQFMGMRGVDGVLIESYPSRIFRKVLWLDH